MAAENKLKIAIVTGTCGVSKFMYVDIPCEVGGPLKDWAEENPVAKIHSTETKIHTVQLDGKPVLVCTVVIVYEEIPESKS